MGADYMKKIWGLIGILGMTFFILAGCRQDKAAEKDASLSAGNETPIENGVGLASVVSIEDAYYYNDLLTTDEGEVYALTDGTSEEGTDPVLVWKSTDQGENGTYSSKHAHLFTRYNRASVIARRLHTFIKFSLVRGSGVHIILHWSRSISTALYNLAL